MTVLIQGVNDVPLAVANARTADENTIVTGNLITDDDGAGVDSDVDHAAALLLVATVNGFEANVGSQITLASGALLTVSADGTYSYDPNGAFASLAAGQSGSDSFTYTLVDPQGGESLEATVTISIVGVDYLSIVGDTAVITGTDSRDSIVYRAQNGQISVNGAAFQLPGHVTRVEIDGRGDSDILNLIGTTGNDHAETGSGTVNFEFNPAHSGFDAFGQNLEIIILDGQGGSDTLTLNDTDGDDKFFARPTSGFMIDTAGQFETDAFGFQMTAIFTTGNDLARLFDSTGNDTLTASPTSATIQGNGFQHTAQNFDVLVARSRNGSDVANLFGTTGNDAFTGRAGIAVLSSTGFNYQLEGFTTINADGLGGSDLVKFFGGPGDDTLTANSDSAQFVTSGFTLNTLSFERMIATAGSGANDVAILNDSAGNDIFAGTVSTGELAGTGFFERTINFDVIRIRGVNGGTNRRLLDNIAFTLIEEGAWI